MTPLADVVLLAGGSGNRLGSTRPKQLLPIGGVSVLARTLRLMDMSDVVHHITITAPPTWRTEIADIATATVAHRRWSIVDGGSSRNGSIRKALADPHLRLDRILVHDAVRPFATPQLIEAVVNGLADVSVVVPVITSNDALLEVEGNSVVGFHSRSVVRQMQSPQGFRRQVLAEAFEHVDSATLDQLGTALEVLRLFDPSIDIIAIEGERLNFKITHHDDHLLADRLATDRPGIAP